MNIGNTGHLNPVSFCVCSNPAPNNAIYCLHPLKGSIPNIQYVVTSKTLSSRDHDVDPLVEERRLMRKLERVATFRNMQAISKVVETYTGRRLEHITAEYYGCILRPVRPNERRYVVLVGGRQIAMIADLQTNTARRVIPDSLDRIVSVVLGMDQCAVNKAMQSFLDFKVSFVYTHWDKIHRLVRDMNKALKSCSNGKFLSAKTILVHCCCQQHDSN